MPIYISKIPGLDIKLKYSIQTVEERGGIQVVMFNWKLPDKDGNLERKQIKRSIPGSDKKIKAVDLIAKAEGVIETWFMDQMKTQIVNASVESKISIACQKYLDGKTTISEETKRPIGYFLKRFFQEVKSDNVAELTPEIITAAANSIRNQCGNGEVKWKYWANIHSYMFGKGSSKNPAGGFIPWMIKRGVLKGSEWENLSIAAPEKNLFKTMHDGDKKNPEYYWENEEIEAIHNELSIIWKDYFWILANTGMDLADLADMAEEHIVPVEGKSGKWKISKVRKKEARFGTRINIPLPTKVEKIILAARNKPKDLKTNPRRLLFPELKDKLKNSTSQLYNRVRAAWQKVYPGTRHKNIKALRHSFITKHLEKNTPMHFIQDFVGHSKNSTMIRERYKGTIDGLEHIDKI